MSKPSRWTAEKRYEVVMEVLRHEEPIAQIARKYQISDAVIHQWRERFFEGGKAALAFEKGSSSRIERQTFERQIEDLQKVIGEQAVEIRFLKKLSRS
jgi:transposase-like protein